MDNKKYAVMNYQCFTKTLNRFCNWSDVEKTYSELPQFLRDAWEEATKTIIKEYEKDKQNEDEELKKQN